MKTDQQILDIALETTARELEEKFRDGMTKYPHPIWEKSGIDEAFPEVYDLLAYLTVARAQRERALKIASYLRVLCEADKGASGDWDELISLLSPKKLAVKKDAIKTVNVKCTCGGQFNYTPGGSFIPGEVEVRCPNPQCRKVLIPQTNQDTPKTEIRYVVCKKCNTLFAVHFEEEAPKYCNRCYVPPIEKTLPVERESLSVQPNLDFDKPN